MIGSIRAFIIAIDPKITPRPFVRAREPPTVTARGDAEAEENDEQEVNRVQTVTDQQVFNFICKLFAAVAGFVIGPLKCSAKRDETNGAAKAERTKMEKTAFLISSLGSILTCSRQCTLRQANKSNRSRLDR